MRQRVQWAMILLLILGTVAVIAADSSSLMAEMKNSNRAQTWEFTIPVRYLPGYTDDFDGGTSIDLNDDLGWGFGFGYNFSEKLKPQPRSSDRKSTRLNSSHLGISYAVFCLEKKNQKTVLPTLSH